MSFIHWKRKAIVHWKENNEISWRTDTLKWGGLLNGWLRCHNRKPIIEIIIWKSILSSIEVSRERSNLIPFKSKNESTRIEPIFDYLTTADTSKFWLQFQLWEALLKIQYINFNSIEDALQLGLVRFLRIRHRTPRK